MNSQEVLAQALDVLSNLEQDTTKGSWVHTSTGGEWSVTNTVGDIVAEEIVHGADADLIVVAKQTLDAQFHIIQTAYFMPVEQAVNDRFYNSVVHLASKIIGAVPSA